MRVRETYQTLYGLPGQFKLYPISDNEAAVIANHFWDVTRLVRSEDGVFDVGSRSGWVARVGLFMSSSGNMVPAILNKLPLGRRELVMVDLEVSK
jgi:hypothetical protein